MPQQNLLELAKQGNAQAITALMNRSLQPHGITAKVNFKDDCLRVLFESEQVPPQKGLVNFAFQTALELNLESISVVKVFGRQSGEEWPTWSQELDLEEMIENLEDLLFEPEEDALPEQSQPPSIQCPRCRSTQLLAHRKGFSYGQAAIGSLFGTGAALVAGMAGSDAIMISCVNCGHQWEPAKIDRPGEKYTNAEVGFITEGEKIQSAASLVVVSLIIAFFLSRIPAIGIVLALFMVGGGIWAGYYVIKVEKPIKQLKGSYPYCNKKLSLALTATQAKCDHCQRKILVSDRKFHVVAK